MNSTDGRIILACACLVCCEGAQALNFVITDTAASLQGGTQDVQESVHNNGGLLLIGKDESFGGTPAEFAGYSGSLSTGSQTLQAEVHALGPHGAGVSATLDYHFKVVGPQDTLVPVTMFTPTPSLSLHAPLDPLNQNRAYASLQTTIDNGSNPLALNQLEEKHVGNFLTGPDTFVPAIQFNLLANKGIGSEHMVLALSVVGVRVDPGQAQILFNATGKLDPFLQIDPNFADAALYHIEFSPGIGNGSPVPTPAAWLCLSSGLLGLGARMRVNHATSRTRGSLVA